MAFTATKQRTASGRAYSIAYSLFAALAPLSLCLYVTGDVFHDSAVSFMGVMALFAANTIYAFLGLRDRLLFLFLHMGIALFLLSRPFISVLENELSWWYMSSYETEMFAVTALYLSMACLLAATAACGALHNHNQRQRQRAASCIGRKLMLPQTHKAPLRSLGLSEKLTGEKRLQYIRWAALLLYAVCLLGCCYAGVLKLGYMSGRAYTDFYLIDSSDYVPWVVDLMAVMEPFMLAGYLATMPRRRGAVLCLIAHVATTLPMLIIGSRSDFVIAFLFAALYFVFRAVTDKTQVWVSKRLIIACCVAIPFGVVAMGLMDYMRAGSTTDLGFADLVVDALYKQGVSFTIMGLAYDVNDQVQSLGFKFYSMSGIISAFTQGFVGQTFFDFPLLPTTNSYELATQGVSYSHAMSFFAHDNYLGGEGYGSSYILELFADFGYMGIAVGSLILGFGLFFLSHLLGRSWFGGMCSLVAATGVFHMPRGYFDEWISYIWSTRFLLAVAALVVVSAGFYFLEKHVFSSRKMSLADIARGALKSVGATMVEKPPLFRDFHAAKPVAAQYVGKQEEAGESRYPLNKKSIATVSFGCIREVR